MAIHCKMMLRIVMLVPCTSASKLRTNRVPRIPEPLSCPTFANMKYLLLGPFPGQMHLAGGKVVDAFGGIDALYDQYQNHTKNSGMISSYPSELAENGVVQWMKVHSDETGRVTNPSHIDWNAMKDALGPGVASALNKYAIAEFNVSKAGHFRIQCKDVLTFYVDEMWFQGDAFASRAWWGDNAWLKWPLELSAGVHRLRIEDTFGFQCTLECVDDQMSVENGYALFPLQSNNPSIFNPGLVDRIPDLVNKQLASPYIAFPVVNGYHKATTSIAAQVVAVSMQLKTKEEDDKEKKWIELDVPQMVNSLVLLPANLMSTANASIAWGLEESITMNHNTTTVTTPVRIQPGQAYPLAMELELHSQMYLRYLPLRRLRITISINASFDNNTYAIASRTLVFSNKDFLPGQAYSYTFLDADGSVQMAAVKPPLRKCPRGTGCDVLLSMHGAGVDATSHTWTNAFDAHNHSWIIFATNRAKFGYDWQGIGRRNGLHSLHAFAQNLYGVPLLLKSKYSANVNRVLFTGHSMGGHGCMIMATHYIDTSIGAACASGWTRYDTYTSEIASVGNSYADAVLRGIVESSVGEYENDVMAVNLKGMPFLGRTGREDTSVTPWNLRRFVRVLNSINADGHIQLATTATSRIAKMSEVPGKHWFDDVMRGKDMTTFHTTQFSSSHLPLLPQKFQIRSMNVWGTGRGGITTLQHWSPFTVANVDVTITQEGTVWVLKTTNVRRFRIRRHVPGLPQTDTRVAVQLGEQTFPLDNTLDEICLVQNTNVPHLWENCSTDWKDTERSILNYGPARQLMAGPVTIIVGTQSLSPLEQKMLHQKAVQFANIVIARGRMGMSIMTDVEAITFPERLAHSNVLVLGGPHRNAFAAHQLVPKDSSSLSLSFSMDGNGTSINIGPHLFSERGVGALVFGAYDPTHTGVFHNRLFTLISGTTFDGLLAAFELIPRKSDMKIPDFMIIGKTFAWKGTGGILSTGYLGYDWKYNQQVSYPHW